MNLSHSTKTTLVLLASACFVATATVETVRAQDPNAIIANLMREHKAQKGVFAIPSNEASVNRYFSKELAALINKDVAAVKKTGDIGAIDFDILYFSQDPQIKDLKISKAAIGGVSKRVDDEPIAGLATIEVTYKDNGQASRTGFQFGQNDAKEWKIDDIHYNDGSSLKSLLESAYP